MYSNDTDPMTSAGVDAAAEEATETLVAGAAELTTRLREMIRERPLAAIGVAAVAGLLVARIGRRPSLPVATAALALGAKFIVGALADRLVSAASSRGGNAPTHV